MGRYAATVAPLYQQGVAAGVADQGEVSQATWNSLDDGATCDDCSILNGQVWYGDEDHPYPGESPYGGYIACGQSCRCSIDYTLVPADQADPGTAPDRFAPDI